MASLKAPDPAMPEGRTCQLQEPQCLNRALFKLQLDFCHLKPNARELENKKSHRILIRVDTNTVFRLYFLKACHRKMQTLCFFECDFALRWKRGFWLYLSKLFIHFVSSFIIYE